MAAQKDLTVANQHNFANKIFVKSYGQTTLSSKDFANVESFGHRLTFSPDQLHSVFIVNLGQSIFSISNPSHVEYSFSITRNSRPVASILVNSNGMTINSQWRVKGNYIYTRPLNASPDILRSRSLNFEINDANRFDISNGNDSFASILMNDKEVFSVQFDGSGALDGFDEFIGKECDRKKPTFESVYNSLDAMPIAKKEIVREFMVEFLAADRAEHGDSEASSIIERFAKKIGI